MAYERRRNGRMYYYRSRRVGGRVVKDYFGAGLDARRAAEEDRQKRAARKVAALERQRVLDAEEAAHAAHESIDLILDVEMHISGFHKNHRTWRCRRDRTRSQG